MRHSLPPETLYVLTKLHDAGYSAWLVGGCVRDDYLGGEPMDYDLASAATPEEAMVVFAGDKVIPTGLKHGTITVLKNDRKFEITSFRVDGPYSDGRRPDHVAFTRDINSDLSRRDFTVNAMAYNPWDGYRDPFDGRADCDRGLLRAVGVPQERFREDSLRILRGLRFSAKLGFEIEAATYQATKETLDGLSHVSAERIATEINLTLMAPHAAQALRRYPRLLTAALPELSPMLRCPQLTPFHSYDVWEHTIRTLDEAPLDLVTRWAALLHDAGKPACATYDEQGIMHFRGHQALSAKMASTILTRLKQPKALIDEVVQLVKYHDDRLGPDNVARWLVALQPDVFDKWINLKQADLLAHAPHIATQAAGLERYRKQAQQLVIDGFPLTVSDLTINGEDLMAQGFAPGQALGDCLRHLFDRVVTGRAVNDKTELLNLARIWRAQQT